MPPAFMRVLNACESPALNKKPTYGRQAEKPGTIHTRAFLLGKRILIYSELEKCRLEVDRNPACY